MDLFPSQKYSRKGGVHEGSRGRWPHLGGIVEVPGHERLSTGIEVIDKHHGMIIEGLGCEDLS